MKLWVQVLFAQGYLWRDRFPDELRDERSDCWKPEPGNLVIGASVTSMGALWVYYGSAIFGPLLIVTGFAYSLLSADFFAIDRVVGSRAFWTSVSWGCGALTVVGFLILLVLSLVWQVSSTISGSPSLGLGVVLLMSISFMAFFGSMSLHAVESRYLFFSDQHNRVGMLNEPRWNPRELWLDTYWHLPRLIVFGIEPPPSVKETPATEGDKDG